MHASSPAHFRCREGSSLMDGLVNVQLLLSRAFRTKSRKLPSFARHPVNSISKFSSFPTGSSGTTLRRYRKTSFEAIFREYLRWFSRPEADSLPYHLLKMNNFIRHRPHGRYLSLVSELANFSANE